MILIKKQWFQKLIQIFKPKQKAIELMQFYPPSEDIAHLVRIRKGLGPYRETFSQYR